MKHKNGELVIKTLPYSKMLKSEVADYTDSVIGIVKAHASQSSLINPALNLLLAKQPDVELLRLSYGIDTERLRVKSLKRKLNLTISVFKLNVKMVSDDYVALDMHVIENAINSYLCYLNKCRNDKDYNQKIAGFVDLLQNSTALAVALEAYGLMDDVRRVEQAHTNFNKAINKRITKLAKRSNATTKEVVDGLVGTVKNLFKVIEVAQLMCDNPESELKQDCSELIDELSQLSEMYNRSITVRDANNRRKASKDIVEQMTESVSDTHSEAALASEKVVTNEEEINERVVAGPSRAVPSLVKMNENDAELPMLKPIPLIDVGKRSADLIDSYQSIEEVGEKQYLPFDIKKDVAMGQSQLQHLLCLKRV